MGMQCHFNLTDLPAFTKQVTYDYDTETYSYDITAIAVAVNCDPHGAAWFDIGSLSASATTLLKYLITNRVPFNCS